MQKPRRISSKALDLGEVPHRVGVLILGMHRSGSSVLSRLFGALGCAMPASLLDPTDRNPKGYWESRAVMELNDALLASAGSKWDDWQTFNPDWYSSPLYPDFIERGRAVLREEYGASALFVLKDPRNCRIARFWFDVFEAEHVRPVVVLGLRNPVEVAQSLYQRDGLPLDHGMLLWLGHMLDAELASRGRARLVVSYDQSLHDWRKVAQKAQQVFGFSWPRLAAMASFDLLQFIDISDRHSSENDKETLENPEIAGWIRETYRILLDWSACAGECETAQDLQQLDSIREQAGKAMEAFSRLLLSGEQSRMRIASIEAELSEQQNEVARLQEEASAASAVQAALEAQQEQAGAQWQKSIEELAVSLRESEAQKNALWQQMQQAAQQAQANEDERKGLLMQIIDLRAREDELTAAFAEKDASLAALDADHRAGGEQLAALAAHVAEIEAECRNLQDQVTVVTAQAEQNEAALAVQRERAVAGEARLAEAGAHASQLGAELAQATLMRAGLQAEVQDLASQMSAIDLARSELQQALTEKNAQLASLGEERDALAGERDGLAGERDALASERDGLASERDALASERDALVSDVERLHQDLAEQESLRHELAQQTSRLQQRNEEVEQAWARVLSLEGDVEALEKSHGELEREAGIQQERADRLAGKLAESEGWVFRLAGERRQTELDAARIERKLASEQRERLAAEQAARRLAWQLDAAQGGAREKLAAAQARIDAERARLQAELQSARAETDSMRETAEAERLSAQAEADALRQQVAQAKAELERRQREAAPSGGAVNDEQMRRAREALAQATARADAEIAALAQRNRALEDEAYDAKQKSAEAQARLAVVPGLHRKMSDRVDEIVVMTGLLRKAEGRVEEARHQQEWLLAVNRVLSTMPLWWRYMPRGWVRSRQAERLAAKGLFDTARYLELYPDVARSGQEPVLHYIHHGMAEGRARPQ